VRPAVAQYEPAGQLEQLEADDAARKRPAAQLVQLDAEVVEYIPAVHAPVTAVRPVVAQ